MILSKDRNDLRDYVSRIKLAAFVAISSVLN
jgi:hypothetical protein